jgi:hypothetical protein
MKVPTFSLHALLCSIIHYASSIQGFLRVCAEKAPSLGADESARDEISILISTLNHCCQRFCG